MLIIINMITKNNLYEFLKHYYLITPAYCKICNMTIESKALQTLNIKPHLVLSNQYQNTKQNINRIIVKW